MANPSTEGGTGAGTEVLRRFWLRNFNGTANNLLINGVADHLYTVLSITWHNLESSALGINLYIYPEAAGGSVIHVLQQCSTVLPARGTFVFNDKLVLAGTDELYTNTESATTGCDAWVSYIDQQFA